MDMPLYSPPISAQIGYCDNHEATHIDMAVLQPLSVSGNRSGAKSSERMACAFSIYTRPRQYRRPPVCYMAFLTGAMSSLLKSARLWRKRCICAPRSRLGGLVFSCRVRDMCGDTIADRTSRPVFLYSPSIRWVGQPAAHLPLNAPIFARGRYCEIHGARQEYIIITAGVCCFCDMVARPILFAHGVRALGSANSRSDVSAH